MVSPVSRLLIWKKAVVPEIGTSCLETSLSSSLDSTDKFEIGRYDFVSAGSMSAFFRIGVIYADMGAGDGGHLTRVIVTYLRRGVMVGRRTIAVDQHFY